MIDPKPRMRTFRRRLDERMQVYLLRMCALGWNPHASVSLMETEWRTRMTSDLKRRLMPSLWELYDAGNRLRAANR